jgi:hypothetical protein
MVNKNKNGLKILILLLVLSLLVVSGLLYRIKLLKNKVNKSNKKEEFQEENKVKNIGDNKDKKEKNRFDVPRRRQSRFDVPKKDEKKEDFLDWSMYNPPISNGFISNDFISMGANYANPDISYQNSLDRIYNPLRYPYRSQAFYEQGRYPNMNLPPQVIGCGGRRGACLGGTQIAVPNMPPPIEISERNIAPVNVMTRGPLGVPQQVGVLYKVFGSLNDVYPLYGRKRFPNSDTWDYYTMIGRDGNRVKAKVITRKRNYNELGTNDVVQIDGNTSKFRVTIYDSDFPLYIPYA